MSAKKLLADLAFRLGLFAPLAHKRRGLGTILMFHEIHSDPRVADFLGSTAPLLDLVLKTLRQWDLDLISADELLPRLISENTRNFVLITFDDGYRDNLKTALPILRKYQAPALINVPTQCVTRELYCWWLALRNLFMERDRLCIDALEETVDIKTLAEKHHHYGRINAWIAEDFTRAELLADMFRREKEDLTQLCEDAFVDKDELRALAQDPLVTIGGHTVSHRPLAALREPEMREELRANKSFLETVLDEPVKHLAYPFGGPAQAGRREAQAALDLGFETAIAVRPGAIEREHRDDPFLLPRFDAGHAKIDKRQLYFMVNNLYRH